MDRFFHPPRTKQLNMHGHSKTYRQLRARKLQEQSLRRRMTQLRWLVRQQVGGVVISRKVAAKARAEGDILGLLRIINRARRGLYAAPFATLAEAVMSC